MIKNSEIKKEQSLKKCAYYKCHNVAAKNQIYCSRECAPLPGMFDERPNQSTAERRSVNQPSVSRSSEESIGIFTPISKEIERPFGLLGKIFDILLQARFTSYRDGTKKRFSRAQACELAMQFDAFVSGLQSARSLSLSEIDTIGDGLTLAQIEKNAIEKALESFNGNRTHASRHLGISIRTIRNKIREYRLNSYDDEEDEMIENDYNRGCIEWVKI